MMSPSLSQTVTVGNGNVGLSTQVCTTWTPTDASSAALIYTSAVGNYCKLGRQVTFSATVTYPITADATSALLSVPFSFSNAYSQTCIIASNTIGVGLNSKMTGGSSTTILSLASVAITNVTLSTSTLTYGCTYISTS